MCRIPGVVICTNKKVDTRMHVENVNKLNFVIHNESREDSS